MTERKRKEVSMGMAEAIWAKFHPGKPSKLSFDADILKKEHRKVKMYPKSKKKKIFVSLKR